MDYDKKTLFSQLDDDVEKVSKKNKSKKKKLDKKDPFGYGFDPDDFKKKSKKKKKKNDKKSSKDKDKKNTPKKIKPDKPDKPQGLGDSKLAKKVLKELRSKELQQSFKKDKVLIDNKKFWSRD